MQLGGRETSRAKGFFCSSPKGCSLCVCSPALLPSLPCKLHTSSYNDVLIPGAFPTVTSTPVPESVKYTGQLGTDTNSPRLWRLLVVAFISLFHGQNTVASSREQLQWIISSWCSLREYLMAEMNQFKPCCWSVVGWHLPSNPLIFCLLRLLVMDTDKFLTGICISSFRRVKSILPSAGLKFMLCVHTLIPGNSWYLSAWLYVWAIQGCFPQTSVGSKAFSSSGASHYPRACSSHSLAQTDVPFMSSCLGDMQGVVLLPLCRCWEVWGCFLHPGQWEGICQALPLPQSWAFPPSYNYVLPSFVLSVMIRLTQLRRYLHSF